MARTRLSGTWNTNSDNHFNFLSEDANRAMLGVNTEKTEEGVKINSVTKESAAEKIGLKKGDVITKIDETKIESPDELSEAIHNHKPADKVVVTYLRDNKEQKATAELTKWKGENFKMDLGDMKFDKVMPKLKTVPGTTYGQNWTWTTGGPKLGLSVQDSDDGKGVKVIEVDEESTAAKAGVKQEDIITEVDGKAINSTDDMVKIIKESKEKASIMVKLQRGGKTQNIEVKMPKKIKTANL
jgi:serine protease Do